MAAGTLEMAEQPKTDKQPVKLERDVHRMLSIIASVQDVSISKLASDFLRPLVEEEYPKAIEIITSGKVPGLSGTAQRSRANNRRHSSDET